MQYSRYQNFCETPKCSQCTFFVKGDKRCLTEICITPVLFIYFFPYQKISETTKISQWISPVLLFKIFPRKNVISPPRIHEKFSLQEIFWNEEVLPRNFSVMWDKKNSTGKREIPFLHPYKLFAATFFLKQRRAPYERFRNSDTEKLRQKNVISPCFIHAIFSLPDILWNTEVVPMHFLGKRRENLFDGNLHYPRLFHIFLPITESFWNDEDIPMNFSGTEIYKTSTENVISPSLIHTGFSLPDFSWNTEEFPEKVFGIVKRKKNRQENVIFPIASLKIFVAWTFVKHRSVPNAIRPRWKETKNVSRKFALLVVLFNFFFPYQKVSETTNSSQWNFTLLWFNFLPREEVISFLASMKNFRYQKFLWNNEVFTTKFFGNVRQKKSTEKRDIPFSHPYKLFAPTIFLKHWIVPNESFWYYESKQNRSENVISPLTYIQIFRYRIFLETLKSSQWIFLVFWDENNWLENVISPVASLSIFATRSFLKQRRVPKENVRNCDTEICDRKTWYPPLSFMQYSHYQNFCETPKCSQCTFSAKGDKKWLTELCITPVLFIYFFPI